jgi:hypothetical protein
MSLIKRSESAFFAACVLLGEIARVCNGDTVKAGQGPGLVLRSSEDLCLFPYLSIRGPPWRLASSGMRTDCGITLRFVGLQDRICCVEDLPYGIPYWGDYG